MQPRDVSRSAALAFGLALFFFALLPRLFVALHWTGEPVWDGHYYDFGARRIAAGFGYSDDRWEDGVIAWHAWCHYPVGYSAALAAAYRVFGADLRVAAVFDASVSAAVCVMTWLLARNAISETRARWAGVIAAIHPGLVLYAALVMTEALSALVTLIAFWIATRDTKHRTRAFVLGAIVLGIGALVRPQALLCAPFFALLPVPSPLARLGKFARPAAAILACVLALAPVLPWTARNCATMDGCALVSTNAGWNLAIGAFPRATGRFETLHASDGCRDVTGQVQQDRCWLAYGVAQIREHPWHWVALVPAKLSYTFDHESFAVEYLREARPSSWPEARRVAWRAVTTAAHRILVCASALAFVAFVFRRSHSRSAKRPRPRREIVAQGAALLVVLALAAIGAASDSPHFYPLAIASALLPWLPLPGKPELSNALMLGAALLATTIVTHAIFFGEDRYHIVVTPVLCIFAAAAFRKPAAERTS
jgi:4-amino-4-deoxy-L-arabinose transferase-like glycosyltransferase